MEANNDYWAQERQCEAVFCGGGPFYIVTSENLPWLLFETEEDFKEGTNIIALSLRHLPIRLLNDVQMNNHLHLVLEGPEQAVETFTVQLRKRMKRRLSKRGKDLNKWHIQANRIEDLQHLRYAILYVARNPYVARRDATPTGYRWGGSHLLFNANLPDYAQGKPFQELSYLERRNICHSHDMDIPEHWRCHNGMILRSSFMDYQRTQQFFLSANQYFQWLSRRKESDIEIAKWIGESILLPNEDVLRIVSNWYKVKSVTALDLEQRLEAARKMKTELWSNNKQIAQVLRLPLTQIDLLFPVAH